MEFIGLLGLIGLLGFFSSKNLQQKFDSLKSEIRRRGSETANLESRVDENEKIIADIRKKLGFIDQELSNCVTNDSLDKTYRQLNSELQEIINKVPSASNTSSIMSKIAELEKKISAIPQPSSTIDFTRLQIALKEFQNKIDDLQKTDKKQDERLTKLESETVPTSVPVVPDASIKVLEQKIAALESEKQNLLKTIAEQNAVLKQYQGYFSQIQNSFLSVQKKINEQTATIVKHEDDIKKIIQSLQSEPPEPPEPSEPTMTIRDFHIKSSNKPLFTNNLNDVNKALANIEDLSGITSFLETSHFDKKVNFISLIKNYKQNLQKFTDKLKKGRFNESSLSEEATDAFFDVLSKYFLATLPVSIYRGNKENPQFYSALLNRVNDYLAKCHVYTELIEPKTLMKQNYIDMMTITKKDTALLKEDKMIDDVERLPYFLDYITDDEIEHFCFDGKMVAFKYTGGVK